MNQIPNIEETHKLRSVEEAKEVIRKQIFLVPRSLDEANAMWATAEKAFDNCLHHQLQKAREEERERIKKIVMILGTKNMANGAGIYKMLYPNEIIAAINHSELDQVKKDDWNEDMERMHGLAELDQDTPIKATTAPRKFPSDYCEACGRVTGTEIYTGACGGCFIKRMLNQDNN